jgi:predicted amidohydrolase
VKARLLDHEAPTRKDFLLFCFARLRALAQHLAPMIRTGWTAGPVVAAGVPSLGGRRYWLLPPPPSGLAQFVPKQQRLREPKSVGQRLNDALPGLTIFPADDVCVDFVPLPPLWEKCLSQRLSSLKVALAPLKPGFPCRWQVRSREPQRAAFRAVGIEDETGLHATLERLLDRCQKEQVDILVLPELGLPPAAADWLADLLAGRCGDSHPLLVVGGSWHVADDGSCRNRCVVFAAGQANPLWQQEKRQRFTVEPGDTELCQKLGLNERGGDEDIHVSATLAIRDLPLGRAHVAICLDFIAPTDFDPLHALRVNLCFVPAFTSGAPRFRDQARHLAGSNLATTFFVNNAASSSENLAFCHRPRRGEVPISLDKAEEWLVFSTSDLTKTDS